MFSELGVDQQEDLQVHDTTASVIVSDIILSAVSKNESIFIYCSSFMERTIRQYKKL